MKKRADILLFEKGLARSRSHARELIERGLALSLGAPVEKPGELVEEEGLTVEQTDFSRFASRGGVKLQGALRRLGISPANKNCLDVGLSTGGFADCLLQAGAKVVVGIDVGQQQLSPKLKQNDRLLWLEKTDIRNLTSEILLSLKAPLKFDLITADVSFISLEHIIPSLVSRLDKGGGLLLLVKPQFELTPESLGKGGIVRDKSVYAGVREKIKNALENSGLILVEYFESPIEGGDGNTEFFAYSVCR